MLIFTASVDSERGQVMPGVCNLDSQAISQPFQKRIFYFISGSSSDNLSYKKNLTEFELGLIKTMSDRNIIRCVPS